MESTSRSLGYPGIETWRGNDKRHNNIYGYRGGKSRSICNEHIGIFDGVPDS